MAQQLFRKLKKEYALGPCILIVGVLGILFGMVTAPAEFPTGWLFLMGIGCIMSIVIPQNS